MKSVTVLGVAFFRLLGRPDGRIIKKPINLTVIENFFAKYSTP